MSHPFKEDAGLRFSHESLVKQINNCMDTLPDSRIGTNTRYEMRDAALSAFSTFFMQSPSFLHQQRSMEKKRGVSNINTLFGHTKFPVTIKYATCWIPYQQAISPQSIVVYLTILARLVILNHFRCLISNCYLPLMEQNIFHQPAFIVNAVQQ